MTKEKIRYQIRAITTKIREGKAKNYYAAIAKIKQLRVKLYELEKKESWNNFLSQ